jgi:hypothetical protein
MYFFANYLLWIVVVVVVVVVVVGDPNVEHWHFVAKGIKKK